jgi:hypothetical protein
MGKHDKSELPRSICDATPIGEEWPRCIMDKDHNGNRHESWDLWWDDNNPVTTKIPPHTQFSSLNDD